jgi:hypothetical protein
MQPLVFTADDAIQNDRQIEVQASLSSCVGGHEKVPIRGHA